VLGLYYFIIYLTQGGMSWKDVFSWKEEVVEKT